MLLDGRCNILPFMFSGSVGVCMTSSLFGKYEERDVAEKLQDMYEVYILQKVDT